MWLEILIRLSSIYFFSNVHDLSNCPWLFRSLNFLSVSVQVLSMQSQISGLLGLLFSCPPVFQSFCTQILRPLWLFYPQVFGSGIIKFFPARESLVCDISAGDGKTANLILQCRLMGHPEVHMSDGRIRTIFSNTLTWPCRCMLFP
jgi:hypothetical protein